MYLSKPTLKELRKVTVKIICGNEESEGSGILLMIDDDLNVLTAAHVIEEDVDKPYELSQIRIYMIRDSVEYNFSCESIKLYDRGSDAAILGVANSNAMRTTGLERVRILAEDVDGAAILCGFHEDKKTLHQYEVNKRSDGIWALNFELPLQPESPAINLGGISGGGVFYIGVDGMLYLAGYMRGINTLSGNNNEILCPSAINFCKYHQLKILIDEHQYDYIADSGLARSAESKINLWPLDKSSYKENHNGSFLSSDILMEYIKQLKDDDEMTILLTGLSGMGKSRLIYEAFNNSANLPNRYFAKYSGQQEAIKGEMEIILQKAIGEDGIVIIDDCPMDFIPQLISIRNRVNPSFRLIFANHDCFSEELTYKKDYRVIKLSPNDLTADVNKYICAELEENEDNKSDVEEIKKLSGGFPQMAIELVNAYKNEHVAGPDAVRHLMPKLLNLSGEEQEETEMAIWRTLSLCMPFPYQDASHEGFRHMIGDNHFTPLDLMPYPHRRSIAVKIINKYKPTLIDVIGDWLYVRPFPLAVWLTSEWFDKVCNSNEHFKEIIDGIMKQPVWVQNSISEGFCKHIQQMHGNKAAFDMVERLVNTDINDPFFNEEVLCSGLGSKLFLAMATVNPAAIASSLKRSFGHKNLEWLKNDFIGDGRRNVVWALEKLCFAKESFRDAIIILARLAVAENESISNNATGQLKQLFHIYLAGTEVDLLNERLWALEKLISEGDSFILIAIQCFGEAFRNGGFVKMGGSEKFGFENKKDYVPKDYEEVLEYWNRSKLMLLDWLNEHSEIVEPLSAMIEERTFQWIKTGRKDILIPLLKKVAEVKDYHWDKEYDALARAFSSFNLTPCDFGIDDLMKRLRNNSFITSIKEARYELHSRYHINDNEMLELSQKLFEPLAEDFIQNNIFSNVDELQELLEDKDYIPLIFIRSVLSKSTAAQLDLLFSTSLKIVDKKTEDYYSSFLGLLCYEAREKEAYKNFLDQLKNTGKERLYVSLMGRTENKELGNFYKLFEEQKKGELKDDFLSVYLRFFDTSNYDQFLAMLKTLRKCYRDRPNSLIEYVISEQFIISHDEQSEALGIIKEALLEYNFDDNRHRLLNDYSHLVIEFLHNWHDKDFAMKINKKMIEAYSNQMIHLSTEGIFTELLNSYADDIWEDFTAALLSQETFLFYYQVKDEIGSGFGFGLGPLFNVGEDRIKQLCYDNPTLAPQKIAYMAPCFDPMVKGEPVNQFSHWFLWLLDNYGNMKEVRDNLSANLGTFSWENSVISYYERNIRCFEMLLNHKKTEVREWAQFNIDENKKLVGIEHNYEDFEHIRYNL